MFCSAHSSTTDVDDVSSQRWASRKKANRGDSNKSTMDDASKKKANRGDSNKSTMDDASKKKANRGDSNKSTMDDASKKKVNRGDSNKSTMDDASKKKANRGDSNKSTMDDASKKKVNRGDSNKSTMDDASKKKVNRGDSNKSTMDDASKKKVNRGDSNKSTMDDASKKKVNRGDSNKSTTGDASKKKMNRGNSNKSTIGDASKKKMNRDGSNKSTTDDTSKKKVNRDDSKLSVPICQPKDRITHLRSTCSSYKKKNFSKPKFEIMFANDQYKYVACLPHKAGSTSWKMILLNNSAEQSLPSDFKMNLTQNVHGFTRWEPESYGLRRLSDYNSTSRQRILKNYYKFMVARHPLDRLLSGYMDKTVGNNEHFRALQQMSRLQLQRRGTDMIDFPAFLELLLEVTPNTHWIPAAKICDPCNVKYNKIVKLETLEEDLLDVVPHLGPHNRSIVVHSNKKGSGAATSFYKYLPAYRNIDGNLFKDIMAVGYDKDMELFGYSMSNVSSSPGIDVMCSSNKLKCC